ncbi:MAG: isopentenyl phosphate kinase [Candidatus Undinarchaeales archaeon]
MKKRRNPSSKELVFIKLGGAAITFKDKKNEVNFKILEQASKEIAELSKDYRIIIGHGSGSFGHPTAKKYGVQKGLDFCGSEGYVETRKSANALNNIVVEHLISAGVPAVPVQTSACTLLEAGKIKEMCYKPLQMQAESDLVPVIYGDVVFDLEKGCSIASTEMILRYLAEKLSPKRIIIGTDVDGVYTKDPKQEGSELIKEINESNKDEILEKVSGASTTDVTGGMTHKVEELYSIAEKGAEIRIINILKKNNLKKAVQGEEIGTLIKK